MLNVYHFYRLLNLLDLYCKIFGSASYDKGCTSLQELVSF